MDAVCKALGDAAMGLFAPSPEEPTEWAGLPSEPLEPRSAADRLATEGGVDALGLVTGAGVASVAIEFPAEVETAVPAKEGAVRVIRE